ncbi:MAG TPA: trypsin-like peptidase domain-containing protein [Planctomycetota bacterium]|nr:trypsin-like peptidase domain-containing protein [Planctomycetota bacterium]
MRLSLTVAAFFAATCVSFVATATCACSMPRARNAAPIAFAPAQTSIAPAVEEASRGLVHVSVQFQTARAGAVRVERSSSGFVVDARGLVVTNEHLIQEIPIGGGAPGAEYWLEVQLAGERSLHAKVIARDARLDLALLQLELDAGELVAAVDLASGAPPAPGSDVFALGRPEGKENFALAGVVAMPSGPVALRQGKLEKSEVLITDAAVLDVVDGGPFVDRQGVVLGIMNTVQRKAYDVKADEKFGQNHVDYAVAVSAAAIRRAFPDRLEAPKASGGKPAADDVAAAIVRGAAPSVVSVWRGADDARPQNSELNDPYAQKVGKSLGSGVIIDPAGLVLASYDVVGHASEVGVRLLDGASFRASVLRTLPVKRLVLLQIKLPEGVRLPAIELGSSDAAMAGETIAVIGNPYGHTPTVSSCVLAALEVDERLRIGGWVHDGHRGGAVVDAAGHLIGIAIADYAENEERERGESYLGVALPIDRIRTWLAPELEQNGKAPSLRAAAAATEKELALRRNTVTKIVSATRDSLLNVVVSAQAPQAEGFDPFATVGELMPLGAGAGVVIDGSGLAITNWHVVHPTLGEDGAQRSDHAIEVTLPSGKRYPAHVLATSRDDDLALIQLEVPAGESVKPVPLGASKPMRAGDAVVAIGNPYGKANTVTVGILAAKDQDVPIAGRLHRYTGMLQTDAAINPGNSGGALLDIEGRLVGINSAGRAGAGLAIPVERVRQVFGQKLLATMGPFLGLTVEDAPDGGVMVHSVDEHGPAAAAGVAVSDLLRSVDERAVASAMDYGNLLLALKSAPEMHLALDRKGERVAVVLHPISHATWRIFRQTGIEVAEVDYAAESQRVRDASIALHRAYTGISDGAPNRLMNGALRVVQVQPPAGKVLDVKPGDLLLGASALVRSIDSEHAQLVRFENLAALRDFLEPLSTSEGATAECWLLRDNKIQTTQVPVTRPGSR